MRKLIIVLLLLSLGLFGANLIAQEDGTSEKGGEKSDKKYSEEEFQAKLLEEVKKRLEKRLMRSGRKKIVEFSNELFRKEGELNKKELDIKRREEHLKVSLGHFEKRVKTLIGKQKKILGCIDENAKQEGERIRHVVRVVSNMRPNNAAQVLSVQDPNVVVKIMALLEPVKVSKIFNLMDKEISARLQKQYLTMKR